MKRIILPAIIMCLFGGFACAANANDKNDGPLQKKSIEDLQKEASAGNVDAQIMLGDYYREKGNEPLKAISWYERAVFKGNMTAHASLGAYYITLAEITKDFNKGKYLTRGFELTKIAAEHGNRMAQYNLGIFYRDGNGVQKDLGLAREWFQDRKSVV